MKKWWLHGSALHQQSLIQQQPCRILCNSVIRARQQLFHNLVIGIDLQRRLGRGNVRLPHGAQHLLHLQ